MRVSRGPWPPPVTQTRRRTVPWILILAVLIVGAFAAYARPSCADGAGSARALPTVAVAAAAAPQVTSGPTPRCGGEAHLDVSVPSAIEFGFAARSLDRHETVATLPDLPGGPSYRVGARTRFQPPSFSPAGLATADLAVIRV